MSFCTKDWTVCLVLLHYLCRCSEEKLSGSIIELKSALLELRMAMGRLCSFCMTYAPIEWWYYHPTYGENNTHFLNVLYVPFQLHCKMQVLKCYAIRCVQLDAYGSMYIK